MGSCIGRCVCEVGKCFCCDCLILKTNLRDSIRRRHNRTKKSQTFTLRRQSSSTTIEFENLMFEFDLPDTSSSMIQMNPTSVTPWLTLRDNTTKEKEFIGQELMINCKSSNLNPLVKSFPVYNSDVTSIHKNQKSDQFFVHELPLIDSLQSRTRVLWNKNASPDTKEKISLGGSSSLGELQWENEIINDEFNANEQNGNELEWDNYEEDSIALHNEAEQLIYEIDELTHSSLNQLTE